MIRSNWQHLSSVHTYYVSSHDCNDRAISHRACHGAVLSRICRSGLPVGLLFARRPAALPSVHVHFPCVAAPSRTSNDRVGEKKNPKRIVCRSSSSHGTHILAVRRPYSPSLVSRSVAVFRALQSQSLTLGRHLSGVGYGAGLLKCHKQVGTTLSPRC